jgi:hypothetical protein
MATPARLTDWINSITAATGVNSHWLNKALNAGVITPDMQPDAVYKAVSKMATQGTPRQMALPLGGDAADDIRSLVRAPAPMAMIPYDNGARGFELGPNNTVTPALAPSPSMDLVPAGLRGLDGPEPLRLEVNAGRKGLPAPAMRALPAPSTRALPSPSRQSLPAPSSTAVRDQQAVNNIASQFDRTLSRGAPAGGGGRGAGGGAQVGGAAQPMPGGSTDPRSWINPLLVGGGLVAGAAAYNALNQPKPDKSAAAPAPEDGLTSTGGTADLAEESRPVPAVQTEDDPRERAQSLIAQLNQMRRQAGGEVPEAAAMMQEINRLMALSNQRRNAMTPQQAQGSSDPHVQAQALIAKLNDMRRQAGGEVPQAQQIMGEVRRLQALGDQRRNAAQTR